LPAPPAREDRTWRRRWRTRVTGSRRSAPRPATAERQAFARRLYERVADKDLAGASAEQRAAAAPSLLAFARRRLPGVAKVRAFNPTLADHGFESRHTIVQIVNDDMPFLVDSIANEFDRREIGVHLLAHPVMAARRDLDGDLVEMAPEAGERARPESMMHIEIDRQADALQLDDLAAALGRVLAEVRLAVEDWRPLRQACLDAIEDLAAGKGADLAEQEEFLRWLEANHFTFLGHRRYRYADDPSQPGGIRYDLLPGSMLGILRRDEVRLFDSGLGGGEAMSRFARGPQKLMIVKTDRRALVHRSGAMDCVIVKTHDSDGRITGEHRLVGLFTSTAYHAMVRDVAAAARPRRHCRAPRRTRSQQPRRQGAAGHPRRLSARRAVPDRTRTRSTAMRSASCNCRNAAAWRSLRDAMPWAGSRPAWCSRRASVSTLY
jgi:glutamate dehydrogenase